MMLGLIAVVSRSIRGPVAGHDASGDGRWKGGAVGSKLPDGPPAFARNLDRRKHDVRIGERESSRKRNRSRCIHQWGREVARRSHVAYGEFVFDSVYQTFQKHACPGIGI